MTEETGDYITSCQSGREWPCASALFSIEFMLKEQRKATPILSDTTYFIY